MKTEIYGTFGPACKEKNILRQMIDAGLTGMRLNLSHTTLRDSVNYIEAYSDAAKEAGVTPQILIDMQGPELRVGEMDKAVELLTGENIILGRSQSATQIPVPTEVISALEVGDQVLLDDGKILIEVESVSESNAHATIIRGGHLQGRKSIKVKDKYISLPPLTAHDIENIKLANTYGVTALMQPFVLSGEDLKKVRTCLAEYHAENIQIFAKIENRLGVECLAEILPEADVIVIARGDLGNDMPLWELPRVQKQIEEACKKANKPYIVVTQMLASMEEHPVPTRAEVSDIFHAVFHGAYGIMVTGETAVGKYPVEAIRYLANTAKEAEQFIRG